MAGWHIHSWSNWEDVKIEDKFEFPMGWPHPWTRQVIRQQSRCGVCNMVRTRSS
jgi:hypothetical protein